MTRRAEAFADPDTTGGRHPNGQAAKTGVSRSIHDASRATFVSVLKTKEEEAVGRVAEVDPRIAAKPEGNRLKRTVSRKRCLSIDFVEMKLTRAPTPLETSSGPDWFSRSRPSWVKRSF